MAALASAGITRPFPIQAVTLPDARSGETLGFSLLLAARLAGGTPWHAAHED